MPAYDLLRPYNNEPAKLKAAIIDDPALRAAVEAEIAALKDTNNRHGYGAIIDRCACSKAYAERLQKALG